MTGLRNDNSRSVWKRLVLSWPAALLLGLVLLAGAFVAMARVKLIVPVDGSGGWDVRLAPPRREIVWGNAKPFARFASQQPDETELITPRLAERGTVLYFSRREPDGQTDLYRARLVGGAWGSAESLASFNTAHDEVGPTVSHDGRYLYFYSNRPGGQGGFDIYVAERTDSGWAAAKNAGSAVNTVAHEYEPALAPDGLTLFFASNRVADARQQAEPSDANINEPADANVKPWQTTLRAKLGGSTFDLFAARREAVDAAWQPAQALAALNRPKSDEGAPFVSPDGAFLYFASDRPYRTGEEANLDLYRARRLADGFGAIENLGSSVNSAASETEPGLSPEGFTLVFASDRDGRDRLFTSTAQEVYLDSAWRVHMPSIGRVWWTALWMTLLLMLAVAVLLVLGGWLTRRAHATRFFMGSVLVHAVLFFLLSLWKLPAIVEIIVTKLIDADPSTQLLDEHEHQSHFDGREAYEKVADLKSLDQTVVPDAIRQITEAMSVPERTDQPLPTIPVELARRLPPERVLFIPVAKRAAPAQPQSQPLQRRDLTRPAEPLELSEPEAELVAAALAAEQPLNPELELARGPSETVPPPQAPAADTPAKVSAKDPKAVPPPKVDRMLQPAVALASSVPLSRSERATAQAKAAEVDADAVIQLASVTPGPPAAEMPAEVAADRLPMPQQPAPPARASLDAVKPAAPLAPSIPRKPQPTPDDQTSPPKTPVAPLPRTASRPKTISVASIENEASIELASVARPDEPGLPGAEPALARTAEPTPKFDVRTPPEMTGPATRMQRQILIGALSDQRNDAAPAFSPHVSRLSARRARADKVVFAEDNVGLRTMFLLRQGDTRKQYIELFGGTVETEKSVNSGLKWLAEHQEANGSWDLQKHEGGTKSNTAATGLALLPFLAAGHTPQTGEYRETVAKAVDWLIASQKENGDLLAAGDQQHLYSVGIASIALCEAYGMTEDPRLKPPAQKAVDFIVSAQHPGTGGWRYNPNQPADTSVVGWMMMALKSGEMAGLTFPRSAHDHVDRWLRSVEDRGNGRGGLFGYQQPSATPAMTAEGLLCLQFMGSGRNDPRMLAGADYLLNYLPKRESDHTSYYWYYATQVMYHMQGRYWDSWNSVMQEVLVQSQVKDGPHAGTWNPVDSWEKQGGRIYSTSLKLLMLEVYYRHLPLYEQLGE